MIKTWRNGRIKLICGDSMQLAEQYIEKGSVDLIFTDPPYLKKYLHLYSKLGESAKELLKPDGFLIAWYGTYWKDKVIASLGQHLEFFYDFILRHRGNTTVLWQKKIISGYKSLLCYRQKGSKALPKTNVLGCITGLGSDKRFHKWGQDENTTRYYIECFSKENDLIVDFFVGGGTVPYVCKHINRRFIGFESDKESFIAACQRIDETAGASPQKELFTQMDIFDRAFLVDRERKLLK